jgi:hypothetical protein
MVSALALAKYMSLICPGVNAPNGWYQMTGGEVPIDTYARVSLN